MYTQAFETAVDHLMLYEVGGWWDVNAEGATEGLIDTRVHRHACGYTNDPSDRGGETKYGIARNKNPTVNVTGLTYENAKQIYYLSYWLYGHCDRLSDPVAILHFDGCVNNGPGTAAKFLQRAAGVDDDGVIGPETIAAANAIDPITLCRSICNRREQYYTNIIASHPDYIKYKDGWFRRIAEMREFTINLSQ